MSGMIGADPDALERLAGDFDRGAGSLESIALKVRTSVHANPWAGARATRFRADWDQRHGPQLKRTALALRTAARQLRIQAQEQRQASSAGGGSITGHRGKSEGASRSWEHDALAHLKHGLDVIGAASALGSNSQQVGRYPKAWEDLLRRSGDLRLPYGVGGDDLGRKLADFLKYKRSFNGIFSVNGLGEKIDNIPGLGGLNKILGWAGLWSAAADLATNPSPLGVSETVAAALKTKTNPVAYLGGVALSSINMAAEAAGETDWSPEAFKTTADFVRANGPGVVVEELGKATKEIFTKRIWSIF